MNTKNFNRVNPFNYFGGKTRYLDDESAVRIEPVKS